MSLEHTLLSHASNLLKSFEEGENCSVGMTYRSCRTRHTEVLSRPDLTPPDPVERKSLPRYLTASLRGECRSRGRLDFERPRISRKLPRISRTHLLEDKSME